MSTSTPSSGPLAGQVALVTGAAQGIGRAIAERLARDGARVVVNDLDAARLADVVAATGATPAPADVSDPDAVAAVVADVERRVGPVTVLVANHAHMSMAPLADADLDAWWRVVDTNLGGTFWLVQAVLPGMRRAGGGRVVVISSEWGVIGWPQATAYAASKAGLISLVKTLGRELAPEGVGVNAIAPGVIDTPQLEVDADDAGLTLEAMRARYAEGIPLGRLGRPEEIAATAAFLASEASGAMVGQVVQVNGGTTRSRA